MAKRKMTVKDRSRTQFVIAYGKLVHPELSEEKRLAVFDQALAMDLKMSVRQVQMVRGGHRHLTAKKLEILKKKLGDKAAFLDPSVLCKPGDPAGNGSKKGVGKSVRRSTSGRKRRSAAKPMSAGKSARKRPKGPKTVLVPEAATAETAVPTPSEQTPRSEPNLISDEILIGRYEVNGAMRDVVAIPVGRKIKGYFTTKNSLIVELA